jgi:glycine cleavage system H protein
VESTKAASEVYAPLSGTVIEVNNEIVDNPALVSDDTSQTVWFFKLKLSNPDEIANLLTEDAYKALI